MASSPVFTPHFCVDPIFFPSLFDNTGLKWDRTFIVPGNHDVCREKITPGAQDICAALVTRDRITQHLATPPDRELVSRRQQDYKTFFDQQYSKLWPLNELGFYTATPPVNDQAKIVILGLNSAWKCYGGDEDRGHLTIGERQVYAALEQASPAEIRIALLHHPFDWLQSNDDARSVQRLLRDRCDLLLCGHLHNPDVMNECTLQGEVITIAAGAIYDDRQSPLSYNFVQLNLDTGRGTVYFRRFNDGRIEWQRDTWTTGDELNGEVPFSLPKYQRLIERRSERDARPAIEPSVAQAWQAAEFKLAEIERLPSLALQDPAQAVLQFWQYRQEVAIQPFLVEPEQVEEPKLGSRLLQFIKRYFDEEELKTLCFSLGENYDDLPAQGRAHKARELIALMQRKSRIPNLLTGLKQARPELYTESELPDAMANQLDTIWPLIDAHPWKPALLNQAAEQLGNRQYVEAREKATIVEQLASNDQETQKQAQDLALVAELAQARREGGEDAWHNMVDQRGAIECVAALQRVDRCYEGRTREIVVDLLADLAGRAEYVEALTQLADTDHGRELLREPEFEQPLRTVNESSKASSQAKSAARKLRTLRLQSLRWLKLWPGTPPADPSNLGNWLDAMGLAFNPFRSTEARLDHTLPEYAVDTVFEDARGARPTWVFGAHGTGKTASAMLLAHYCNDPPGNPREPNAFPVYYNPPLDLSGVNASDMQRAHLEEFTRAAARDLIRFLAVTPNGFLELKSPQQDSLAYLLLVHTGSQDKLAFELRRAAPTGRVEDRLLRGLGRFSPNIPLNSDLDVQSWLDLLSSAVPAGYTCFYALADVVGRPSDDQSAEAMARQLQPLLDLTVSLAAVQVYLKAFIPEVLRPHLDEGLTDLVDLSWDKDGLSLMLDARIRRAGGDSLAALCGPDVPIRPSLDERLIKAALKEPTVQGPPRRLLRLGNELLLTHVRRAPNELFLSNKDIDQVLPWAEQGPPDEGEGNE